MKLGILGVGVIALAATHLARLERGRCVTEGSWRTPRELA